MRFILIPKKIAKMFIWTFILIFLLLPKQTYSCPIFYVIDKNGHVLMGRNFDWETKGGRIWFIPSNDGYNAMAILEQLGGDMPYEGINDKGLFVGISAVPETKIPSPLF